MSKGSKDRVKDLERFRNNFDGIKGWECPSGGIIRKAMEKLKRRKK